MVLEQVGTSRSPILLASIHYHQKSKEEFEFKIQEFENPKKEFRKHFWLFTIATFILPLSGITILILVLEEKAPLLSY